MATTLIPLTATRINGEVQATPQTIYLNPELVIFGTTFSGGTNITYQLDDKIQREYDVTESATTIAAASKNALLSVTLSKFQGELLSQPKNVLLNASRISSAWPARNPATGAQEYTEITYSREGVVNEKYTATQSSSTFASAIQVLGSSGSTEIIPLGRITFNHTVGVNDSYQGTSIAEVGQPGGTYHVNKPFKVKRLITYSNVLPTDVAGGGNVSVDLSVKYKTGPSSTALVKVAYNAHTSGSEWDGPESLRYDAGLRGETGQGYVGTCTQDEFYTDLVLKPLESYYYLNANGGMNQNLSATKAYTFDCFLEVEYV